MNTVPCRSNLFKNNDDAIMYVIEHRLKATSREKAVTLEQIIDTGINHHLCYRRPRNGKDGHPWSPRISVLMGIGTPSQTRNRENIHLFREKRTKGSKSVYYYWIDNTRDHRMKYDGTDNGDIMSFFKRFKKFGNIWGKK